MKENIKYKEDEHPRSRKMAELDLADKPRERALANGIDSLSNADLMAIIFGSGLPGKSVIDLSRDILEDNDWHLASVARMTIEELCSRYNGIGPAKAVSLAAAFELGARCQRDMARKQQRITGSSDIYSMMRMRLENINHEEFWVLHLSRSNTVMYMERAFKGGTASTVVDVKMVMKSAVNRLSSGLIFLHNHPSGNLQPSVEDDRLTKRLTDAAKLLDIRVLDHVIISSQGYYSYADQGRI